MSSCHWSHHPNPSCFSLGKTTYTKKKRKKKERIKKEKRGTLAISDYPLALTSFTTTKKKWNSTMLHDFPSTKKKLRTTTIPKNHSWFFFHSFFLRFVPPFLLQGSVKSKSSTVGPPNAGAPPSPAATLIFTANAAKASFADADPFAIPIETLAISCRSAHSAS